MSYKQLSKNWYIWDLGHFIQSVAYFQKSEVVSIKKYQNAKKWNKTENVRKNGEMT